jgi:NADPH:quinone reductase-like Zn-dependent oxidoreductase
MSNELIITPNVNSASTVIDMSAHRAQLPSAYNSFRVSAVDPLFGEDREAQIMLLYPLYFTSFVVDDFIEDDEELQKAQVIISSASAKTAIGAAQLAHRRGAHVVGVTSKGNADFVRALGVYDEVLLYDQVGEIAPVPSVYVDITGNQDLCYRIHTHLGDSLLHSMVVGGTMMGQPQTPHPTPLPGPTPTFLFAPSRIKLRTGQWGVDELNRRVAAAWEAFVDSTDAWLRLETYEGLGEAERVYQQLLAGIMDPAVGYDIQL